MLSQCALNSRRTVLDGDESVFFSAPARIAPSDVKFGEIKTESGHSRNGLKRKDRFSSNATTLFDTSFSDPSSRRADGER